jgi:hypothetical protein
MRYFRVWNNGPLVQNLRCPECGEFLENTPSGKFATCPKRHGKLKPRLTGRALAFANAARQLPTAEKAAGGLYRIGERLFRFATNRERSPGWLRRRARNSPFGVVNDQGSDAVVALLDGAIREFTVCESALTPRMASPEGES